MRESLDMICSTLDKSSGVSTLHEPDFIGIVLTLISMLEKMHHIN